MRADGSGLRRVTNTSDNDSHPQWTPDGEIIMSAVEKETRTLSGLNPETGTLRKLFETPRAHIRINLSPDRDHIVFSVSSDSTPRFYVRRLASDRPAVALTPHGHISYEGAWSRDGSRFAFYYDVNGAHELFVADADGRDIRQLTNARR